MEYQCAEMGNLACNKRRRWRSVSDNLVRNLKLTDSQMLTCSDLKRLSYYKLTIIDSNGSNRHAI